MVVENQSSKTEEVMKPRLSTKSLKVVQVGRACSKRFSPPLRRESVSMEELKPETDWKRVSTEPPPIPRNLTWKWKAPRRPKRCIRRTCQNVVC
eukprot:scaffold4833_cov233-Amphora_coffeaeformis.AAC.6